MFRRLKTGLPKDPDYPTNLVGLGYFINSQDEIRNIENPKAYFKFFLTKNERYNIRQREAMNEVIRNLISARLETQGLKRIRLPLNAQSTEPNVPIFVSQNIQSRSRIIILFYEDNQDLGIFAHRIIGGQGGVNAGSAVNFVSHIKTLPSSPSDPTPPGIIIANIGQLRWWRRGQRAVTQTSWYALPAPSAVEPPYRFDEIKNRIPHNRSTNEHARYIFEHVVTALCDKKVKIDVVGVSEGAMAFSKFLDEETIFEKWGSRIMAFAAMGTYYDTCDMKTDVFKQWMSKRGRAYQVSNEPCNTLIAGPEGTRRIPAFGCPAFSLGEPYYTEALLPVGYETVLGWFQEVSVDPQYENPQFKKVPEEPDEGEVKPW